MDKAVERFNEAATELQNTEFRLPKTPGEWQRMRQNPPKRDYAKLFTPVAPLVDAFCSLASPAERTGVASKLSPDALGTLRTFAHMTAVLAYRQQSPALIEQGLLALVILGEVDDFRDLLFYLATLHYSASRLGIDTQ